jgi:16S rRNA (adenine1518-N6/adenine1519-N6)-dimethyltransferase
LREDICRRAADAIGGQDELIFEIGAGTGALSAFLALSAGHLALLEIDSDLCLKLEKMFSANPRVYVHNVNALKFDFCAYAASLGAPGFIIAGNLPYYITTPLLKCFLSLKGWRVMLFMLQKESAQRILSPTGSKDYGFLNIKIACLAAAEILEEIPPTAFYPQPKVHSVLMRLDPLEKPLVCPEDENLFFALASAALLQRRKTLLNSLSASPLPLSKYEWQQILSAGGIEEKRRGESICAEELSRLNQTLKTWLKNEASPKQTADIARIIAAF